MKQEYVFVYEDSDYCDIEVFSTLEKAKKYAEKERQPCVFEDGIELWDYDGHGSWEYVENDYVHIYEKRIK